MRNLLCCLGLALSLVACMADDDVLLDVGADAGEVDKNIVTTPKGLATSPSLGLGSSPDDGPVANVGGGGECGTDPVEQERNCPGGGGSSGGTCDRIGQACPPPPGSPHDRVCSYEQGSNGCVCRCFVPGGPALTSGADE